MTNVPGLGSRVTARGSFYLSNPFWVSFPFVPGDAVPCDVMMFVVVIDEYTVQLYSN